MNRENFVLTLAAAFVASIVMCIALFWAPPVVMLSAGFAVFALILKVGLESSGSEPLTWELFSEIACVWIWLSMLISAALLSACFVCWILGAGFIVSFVMGLWSSIGRAFVRLLRNFK